MPKEEMIMEEERLNGNPALIVVSGNSSPFVLPLNDRRRIRTLGRDPDNDIVLDSTLVSPHHCRIFFARGTWVIQDTGSATGLVMNGARIPGKLLEDGDVIRIDASSSRMAEGVMLLYLDDLQDTDRGTVPTDGSVFQFGYDSGALTVNRGDPISNALVRIVPVGNGASLQRVNERAHITLNGADTGPSAPLADRDVIRAATGILIYTKSALYWLRSNPAQVRESAPAQPSPEAAGQSAPSEAVPVQAAASPDGSCAYAPPPANGLEQQTPTQGRQQNPYQNAAAPQSTFRPAQQNPAPDYGYGPGEQADPYAAPYQAETYATVPDPTSMRRDASGNEKSSPNLLKWGIAAGIAVVLWGALIGCLASGFGIVAIPLILVCAFFGILFFDEMKTGPIAEQGTAVKTALGVVAGVIVTPLKLADLILDRFAG